MDPLHEVGGESGDLVAEALRGDDGDLLKDFLVSMKIEGHSRIVPLDHLARGLLHRFCPHSSHVAAVAGSAKQEIISYLKL